MIRLPPGARRRRANGRAIFALPLALLAVTSSCGREPSPAARAAPAAATPETPKESALPAQSAPAPESASAVEAPAPESAPAAQAAAPGSAPAVQAAAPEPQVPVGLAVGNRAPDFEAQDLDGKKFRLSDYRGKIVALDFWGFW